MDDNIVYKGKFIQVVNNNSWEYVSRVNSQYAVSICALTPNNEIILVEQFRVPIQKNVIENPAGLVGDQKDPESALATAKRELMEETGYESDDWKELYKTCSSPGLTDEKSTKFLALKCKKVAEGGGVVGEEDITVHRVPLKSLITWVERKRSEGLMVDAGLFSALYIYQNTRGFDPN